MAVPWEVVLKVLEKAGYGGKGAMDQRVLDKVERGLLSKHIVVVDLQQLTPEIARFLVHCGIATAAARFERCEGLTLLMHLIGWGLRTISFQFDAHKDTRMAFTVANQANHENRTPDLRISLDTRGWNNDREWKLRGDAHNPLVVVFSATPVVRFSDLNLGETEGVDATTLGMDLKPWSEKWQVKEAFVDSAPKTNPVDGSTFIDVSAVKFYDAEKNRSRLIAIDKELSRGGFGAVFSAKGDYDEEIAVKIYISAKHDKDALYNIQLEMSLWYHIEKMRREIVKLEEYGPVPLIGNFYASIGKGQSKYLYFSLMPLCTGSLGTVVRNPQTFRKVLNATYDIMYQMALAIQFLHTNNCVHLDMKPDNFLFKVVNEDEDDYHVYVSDFGFTNIHQGKDKRVNLWGYTAPYRPFECTLDLATTLVKHSDTLTEEFKKNAGIESNIYASDVYALGVSFLELLTCGNPDGKQPFLGRKASFYPDATDYAEAYRWIPNETHARLSKVNSKEVTNFLHDMTKLGKPASYKNSPELPIGKNRKRHIDFTSLKRLVRNMTLFDPVHRWDINTVKDYIEDFMNEEDLSRYRERFPESWPERAVDASEVYEPPEWKPVPQPRGGAGKLRALKQPAIPAMEKPQLEPELAFVNPSPDPLFPKFVLASPLIPEEEQSSGKYAPKSPDLKQGSKKDSLKVRQQYLFDANNLAIPIQEQHPAAENYGLAGFFDKKDEPLDAINVLARYDTIDAVEFPEFVFDMPIGDSDL